MRSPSRALRSPRRRAGWSYRVTLAGVNSAIAKAAAEREPGPRSLSTELEKQLNAAGADGYEVVGFSDGLIVLKRPD